MNNNIWYSKFLCKFDNEGTAFVNQNGEVQFKIKILSNSPSDFPPDVRSVYGFSGDLEKYGYIDHFTDTEDERIEKVSKFLEDIYLTFSVRESEHSDEAIDRIYYNSFDVSVKSKEDLGVENTFFPIPLLLTRKKDVQITLEKIAREEYIGKNKSISLHHDDYPSFLLIGEKEEGKKIDDINNFHAIGLFTEMQYKEQYGIKLINETPVKAVDVKNDILGEYYPLDDGVIFLTNEKVTEIEDLLSSAIPFKLSDDSSKESVEDLDEIKFLNDFENVCKSKGL